MAADTQAESAAPLALKVGVGQVPLEGLQVTAFWHRPGGGQATVVPVAHLPEAHISAVHRLPSRSHDVPLALAP